jgi:hypothetical protein
MMAAVLTLRADRRAWSDEDTALIVRMRREGAVDADIIEALGVTKSSFDMRIHRLLKERNVDLPRANRPDWGQAWTPERDAMLARLRNEGDLYDDESAELLGVTRAKMVTRSDWLRDLGTDISRARKGRKPIIRPAAPVPVATTPTLSLVPSSPSPEPPVSVDVTTLTSTDLERAAHLRRDLARRRHRCTDPAERTRLGDLLLVALDLEEEVSDLAVRTASVASQLAELEVRL